MVLTVADIERWSAGAVRDVFHVATARGNATLEASRQLSTLAVFDTWQGATAEARKHTNASIRQDLDAHGNESLAVAQAAGKAANDIEHVQSELRALRADATALHMTIDAATNKIVAAQKMPPMEAELAAMQLQPRLDKILAEANAVDAELAAAINMADGDAPIPAGPPPPAGQPGAGSPRPPGATQPPPSPGQPDPTGPRYTKSPLTDPIVSADPSVIARQADKVAEARRALDAAQAKFDAAARQAYTQGAGAGPGRDVTVPLSQAVFDARRNLTQQTEILNNLNKSAAATGAARPIPAPPLPPNAEVQAFPPGPSVASQAAKGLSDASHDLNKYTLGIVPDVAKDIKTFGNWGQAGAGERTDAILDSASLIPGGKVLGWAHDGLRGLSDVVRHGDDIPTPHLDAPSPHTDVPSPADHHIDTPPPVEHHAPDPVPPPPHHADVFDPNQGSHYSSGDGHHPGGWPPGTPEATWTRGDTDPGWHYIDRGPDKNWMPYQEQISGAERLPDGRIPEYAHVDPSTGNPVNFDGHTYRDGHEVFLDAKDGYSALATAPGRPWTQGMEQSILNEVPRQLAALPPGATLEIHVSDPVGAAAIRNLLETNDLFGATVIFTPKAP